MRTFVCFALALLILHAVVMPQFGRTSQHLDVNPYQRVGERFISPETGRVNYDPLKANRADLDSFVAQLARAGPLTHQEDYSSFEAKFALRANACNALVIKGVADNYLVPGVKKIKRFHGFCKRCNFELDGQTVVLDHIEHKLLRPLGDPRVHFAVNCASISCLQTHLF